MNNLVLLLNAGHICSRLNTCRLTYTHIKIRTYVKLYKDSDKTYISGVERQEVESGNNRVHSLKFLAVISGGVTYFTNRNLSFSNIEYNSTSNSEYII